LAFGLSCLNRPFDFAFGDLALERFALVVKLLAARQA
jgi:hypothetical protein